MSQDPLFQPTVRPPEDRGRPWRLMPLGYVAFFGGITAVTVLSLMNAKRLGVTAPRRRLIGLAGVVAFALAVTGLTLLAPESARGLHALTRAVAVVAYLVMAAVQKPQDRLHELRGGEYASPLRPGLIAVFACGIPEGLAFAGVVLAVRL
jgi:hypothetical protein